MGFNSAFKGLIWSTVYVYIIYKAVQLQFSLQYTPDGPTRNAVFLFALPIEKSLYHARTEFGNGTEDTEY